MELVIGFGLLVEDERRTGLDGHSSGSVRSLPAQLPTVASSNLASTLAPDWSKRRPRMGDPRQKVNEYRVSPLCKNDNRRYPVSECGPRAKARIFSVVFLKPIILWLGYNVVEGPNLGNKCPQNEIQNRFFAFHFIVQNVKYHKEGRNVFDDNSFILSYVMSLLYNSTFTHKIWCLRSWWLPSPCSFAGRLTRPTLFPSIRVV